MPDRSRPARPPRAPDARFPWRGVRAAAPLELQAHAGLLQLAMPRLPLLALVEVRDDLPAAEDEAAADALRYVGAEDPEVEDLWEVGEPPIEPLVDPNLGLLLAGERRLCYFHPGAGRYVPLPGVQFHLAVAEAAIPAGGSGPVRIYSVDDSGPELPTEHVVTAHDWWRHDTAQGGRVVVFHHQQSRRWYLLSLPEFVELVPLVEEVLETYGLIESYEPSDLAAFSVDDSAGTVPWLEPGNAAAGDQSYAGTEPLTEPTGTRYLKALEAAEYAPSEDFSPRVVYVTVTRRDAGGSGRVSDGEVKLVIDGTIQEENAARTGEPWSSAPETKTYRFTPALSREQSLAEDFGAVIRAVYDGGSSLVPHLLQTDFSTAVVEQEYEGVLGPESTSGGPPAVELSASGGGNPGSALQLDSSATDGDTTRAYLLRTADPWNPAEDGPLVSIAAAVDVNSISVSADGGPHLISYRWALRQQGVLFHAAAGARVEGAGWGVLSAEALAAADFVPAAGGPPHPDFSSGGGPIEFGLACGVEGVSLGGGTGEFRARFDNFEITLRTGHPPGQPQIDHVQIRLLGVDAE